MTNPLITYDWLINAHYGRGMNACLSEFLKSRFYVQIKFSLRQLPIPEKGVEVYSNFLFVSLTEFFLYEKARINK